MSNPLPCAYCGDGSPMHMNGPDGAYVMCRHFLGGPARATRDQAIVAWNEMQMAKMSDYPEPVMSAGFLLGGGVRLSVLVEKRSDRYVSPGVTMDGASIVRIEIQRWDGMKLADATAVQVPLGMAVSLGHTVRAMAEEALGDE